MADVNIIDASVAVKWVIREDLTPQADAIYREAASGGRPLHAPGLLPNEVTNAIYQQPRRGRIAAFDAEGAVANVALFPMTYHWPADLPADAFAFVWAHQLPAIYDCLYAVLAQRLGADLWTADACLFNALRPTPPWLH